MVEIILSTWPLAIIGGLILMICPWHAFIDSKHQTKSQQLAMERRLRAFEQQQRVRQSATARRCACELNSLAYQTYRAMLLVALEAQRQASNDRDK